MLAKGRIHVLGRMELADGTDVITLLRTACGLKLMKCLSLESSI